MAEFCAISWSSSPNFSFALPSLSDTDCGSSSRVLELVHGNRLGSAQHKQLLIVSIVKFSSPDSISETRSKNFGSIDLLLSEAFAQLDQ